jgi:hypothetical protein
MNVGTEKTNHQIPTLPRARPDWRQRSSCRARTTWGFVREEQGDRQVETASQVSNAQPNEETRVESAPRDLGRNPL